jgi:DNA modification methylase
MKVELWPIDRVKPYFRNPRVNDSAVDAVAASLKEFGFRQPSVVDADGVIIVGHTRWKAARKLGLAKVPVHVAKDLTAEQIKAYRIADNQTATIAEWDKELLPLELADLKDADFDLGLLGFSEDDLAKWLQPVQDGLCDPDDVPAPPDEATTKPGDIILLGNHRLVCGDSSKPEDVDRLLDGASIHLVNTDPPYNVNVEPASNSADTGGQRPGKRPLRNVPSWRSLDGQRARGIKPPRKTEAPPKKTTAKGRRLMGDFVSDEEFAQRLQAWFGNIGRVLQPGRCFYLWGGYANIANYPPALEANDLYMSQCVIWVKCHPVISRKDYMGDHEWCFYGWREGAAHKYFGPTNATDVWSVKKVSPQKMVHLTEKPVELAVRAIQYSSREGENVLDLFGGSGSTLIAAEQTGRKAYLMELDPLYCDVIVARFEQFAGKKAERLRSDETVRPAKKRQRQPA